MNSTDHLNSSVENVEFVETSRFPRGFRENSLCQSSTKNKSKNVESVEGCNLDSYFSTLSTKLRSAFVENTRTENHLTIKDLNSIPHVPQFPREQKGQLMHVFEWLQIAIREGHIEPSQPCVGRIFGWPELSKCRRTLWSDFILWCRKRELSPMQIADSHLFFSVLDRIFERRSDHYEFPPLDVCQNKYSELKREYESFTASE